jgi:hypothetical protein
MYKYIYIYIYIYIKRVNVRERGGDLLLVACASFIFLEFFVARVDNLDLGLGGSVLGLYSVDADPALRGLSKQRLAEVASARNHSVHPTTLFSEMPQTSRFRPRIHKPPGAGGWRRRCRHGHAHSSCKDDKRLVGTSHTLIDDNSPNIFSKKSRSTKLLTCKSFGDLAIWLLTHNVE